MSVLPRPRMRNHTWEFPVHHMRGGTSTGLVLWNAIKPASVDAQEELLRHLMGVPLAGENGGNRQITGLGRGPATSNKVFFADIEHVDGYPRLVSTLAQLAAGHGRIDWSVNCGNMSSALQLWALDTGLVDRSDAGLHSLEIRNTNTGVITTSRMKMQADGTFEVASIPGVMGVFPAVDLFLRSPAGAKTGTLLPTGNPMDVIDGVRLSCVDVAVPMVIIMASELGKTAHEPVRELETDVAFMTQLKEIWVKAGLKMGLRRKDGALLTEAEIRLSETVPKVCIIGESTVQADLAVRYFTPQTGHASLAVSGGCCLAAAALIPGSVAHELAPKHATVEPSEIHVNIENPAGVLSTTVVAVRNGDALAIQSAAYQRSTQILLSGYVPLYGASNQLKDALAMV